jgi:enamine deaminase RidA (YjgF/YER057c/UK114 family)
MNLVVYLQDMRDFPTFHRVHEQFFGDSAPALTVIEAGEVGHKGTLIEIEPTAIVPGKGIRLNALAGEAAGCGAKMSAAVEAGGLAFLSGIPGVGPDGAPVSTLPQLPAAWRKRAGTASPRDSSDPLFAQAVAIVAQLDARMKALGSSLARIVHLTVFLDDIGQFPRIAPLFEKAFGKVRPALYVIEVQRPAPLDGVRISATAIAWLGDDAPAMIAR